MSLPSSSRVSFAVSGGSSGQPSTWRRRRKYGTPELESGVSWRTLCKSPKCPPATFLSSLSSLAQPRDRSCLSEIDLISCTISNVILNLDMAKDQKQKQREFIDQAYLRVSNKNLLHQKGELKRKPKPKLNIFSEFFYPKREMVQMINLEKPSSPFLDLRTFGRRWQSEMCGRTCTTGSWSATGKVWWLTQFYSASFSQLRISVKKVYSSQTHNQC